MRILKLNIEDSIFAEIMDKLRTLKNDYLLGNIYNNMLRINKLIFEANGYDSYSDRYYYNIIGPKIVNIINDINTYYANNPKETDVNLKLSILQNGLLTLKDSLVYNASKELKPKLDKIVEENEDTIVFENDYYIEYLEAMKATRKVKNADYGNSFNRSIDKFGYVSAFSRIEDKLSRAINLINTGKAEVSDEAIEDSLIDAANYLVMTAADIKERKDKNNKLIWAKKS